MRFLIVTKQKKVAEAFLDTLRSLIDRGHSVTLAVQEHDEKRGEQFEAFIRHPNFSVVPCPEVRSDEWADVVSLLRRIRDCVHYLRPPLRGAVKLRTRAVSRLHQDLLFDAPADSLASSLLAIPSDQVRRVDTILNLAEQRLPPDPLFSEFLEDHAPDVLLLSPLVHFGPAQADLLASARSRGIPVWMLLYSWDNLSTKGALHRWPDLMFVWNEQQRREAVSLHEFPPERVIVAGAPRFDEFFAMRAAMTREHFLAPLGLESSHRTLLYVCSSRFVSERELAFVQRWVTALRQSASEQLRTCNIIVRPHPDIALLPAATELTRHRWAALPGVNARVGRPFGDDRSLVLLTANDTPRGLFESIVHSDAVVGLNTTAEIEAGIVGRPVFTIVAAERDADGQSTTVHFHYLRKEHGGFVSTADSLDEHMRQLDAAFDAPLDPAPIRHFIESFVRPHGFDKPVSPLLAELLESAAASACGSTKNETTAAASRDTEGIRPAARSDRAVVRLGDPSSGLLVYETSIAQRRSSNGVVPIAAEALDWIRSDLAVGDVVYDIGAGIGEYSLVAAKQKGATVVAFEPGYAAHAELCENILLNRCEALIVPVPLALAGREGLAEIKYLQGLPGEPGYLVRDDIQWRVKHRGRNKPYLQPACLVTLDSFVERQRPPAPHHIRVASHLNTVAILCGATQTLQLPSVKTLLLQLEEATAAEVVKELAQRRWVPRTRLPLGTDVPIIFVRQES